ncbi:hypothetical protein D3C86_2167850 [compost metagenome]
MLDPQVGVDKRLADQRVGVGRVVFERFCAGREERVEQFQVNQHFEGIGGITGEE